MSDHGSARSVGINAHTWQRWRLSALDHPEQSDLGSAHDQELIDTVPEPEPEPDPEAVREAARQQGFDEGLRQGREQGHIEGHTHGYASGLEEGRAKGQDEGYAAGLAEGQALAHAHAEQLKHLADELARSLRDLEEDIGQGLVSLALDIARHVVGDTLTHRPDTLITAVRQVTQTDPAASPPLRLWVHPDDLALVNGYLADDIIDSDWHILTDATLSRGGCRAETAFGAIDATLQTRWRRVAASLGRKDEWEDPR